MSKRKFKTESARLLEMMINSIYTHHEIFLRELISNASDAIDKYYYKALTDKDISFDRDNFFIKIEINKADRQLIIRDTGIGMTKDELADNLGVIAKSGSLAFKKEMDAKDEIDIIGQFGVGFYSAFMVADKVTVISRAYGSDEAYQWESTGADGYTLTPAQKDDVGTEIVLNIRESTEEVNYDEYLEEHRIHTIIKKYSDFIRYPIKMDISERKLKEGSEDEYEYNVVEEVVNSMVPIWRKNKSELTDEDYENFYMDKHYGYDTPLKHMHVSVDGTVRYDAILYIPSAPAFDYYSESFEKGLELYSSGVLIMNKSPELLPDYFSFVKGMVDSEDLSLNISREMLQHDRQLQLIAKNIKTRIKNALLAMMKDEGDKYEAFYKTFGRQLKYGIYSNYGADKDFLQDLLLFHSSTEDKLVTLADYVSRMKEDQKYIYYATGVSNDRISRLPQTELVADEGYEILYFTEEVDEFAIKMMRDFDGKAFKSVTAGDLGIESKADEVSEEEKAENQTLFDAMKEILADKVKEVRISKRLKSHPVCLAVDGELSIEMEKILAMMPDNQGVKADKILEINVNHDVFQALKAAHETDKDKFKLYTDLLYNQALMIEGLEVEDPVEFANSISQLMK